MQSELSKSNLLPFYKSKEFWIQMAIFLIFFLVSSLRREGQRFEFHRFFFMANYVVAALTINYFLLPRYFYEKKFRSFWIGVVIILVLAILMEEYVLEQIFLPDTRGARFSSVIFTLLKMTPVVMLLVGFKFAWDIQNKQTELDRLKNVVTESQLQFLKSQINPHFLFNSLNNLYSYALENSPKTPSIILELSSLLRYMLYDCQESQVPLAKEVKYLEDFVKLQSLQIEDRGEIKFSAHGSFQEYSIAPLILIVFVENCFKHSTSSLAEKIMIDIDLEMEDVTLHLKCSNTFSSEQNTESLTKGIGLENVVSRLNLLYPEAHSLTISSTDDLYKVDLKISLVS